MPHDAPDGPRKVLGWPTIWIAAAIILLVTIGSGIVLFWIYPPPGSKEALDIIRTAGTLGVGTGGAAALLLHARRQRSTEQANELTREANENTRHDAEERRIAELQAKAGEQLSSDKAAVRLYGLYQLERLAQKHEEHRQVIVNVICAYLRMPWEYIDGARSSILDVAKSVGPPAGEEADREKVDKVREELQVRLAAQEILANHLRESVPLENFWEGVKIDLSGATLIDLDFSRCKLVRCRFVNVRFRGLTRFHKANFEGVVLFSGAYLENASFGGTRFREYVSFDWVQFREADFRKSILDKGITCFESKFTGRVNFDEVVFGDRASFGFAEFDKPSFVASRFASGVDFKGAKFPNNISMDKARMRWDTDARESTWPSGWLGRAPESEEDGRIEGVDGIWGYVVPEVDPVAADGDA
ncbi:pentapeptide repeat-containing protein [Saccharopolyspora shandongensis]|uniref:pentapeptide repeat-containing protein n=1 Tax=Saccharopolyspora shandongensis TaxID=418495 RepID=UPI00342623FB